MRQDAGQASEDEDFVPLTREQAQQLRLLQPMVSPWRVVAWQLVVGLMALACAWIASGTLASVRSVGCGALAVVLPAALFARGVTGRFSSQNPGSAVLGFFVWELVKIVTTVGLLLLAQRLVSDLSWPWMLAGMVLVMKVYWVALMVNPKASKVQIEGLTAKVTD